jgi:hypothetical protein
MFTLDLSQAYWWPVKFKVPSQSGLDLVDMSFEAEFKRFTTKQVDEMFQRAGTERVPDTELARQVMVGWRQVVGAAGVIPFSAEALGQLLEVPGAGSAIMRAFFESISKGAEKN